MRAKSCVFCCLGLIGLLSFVLWACSGSPAATSETSERLGQARQHIADQGYGEAAALLRPLVQAGSAEPEVYFLMGQVSRQQRELQRAADFFQQTIERQPDHIPARLALAELFLAAGQIDQARSQIEHILRLDPGHAEALLLKGAQLLARGESLQAGQLLAELLADGKGPPEAYLLLAAARSRQKDAQGARQALEEGIAVHPAQVALHLQLAQLLVDDGQPEAAEARMRQVIALDPGNPEYPLALAVLYWDLGRTEKAEALLAQLIRESAADGRVYSLAADFYLQREQIAKAEELLLAGMAALPGAASIPLALNRFYQLTGQQRKGIETLLACLGGDQKPAGESLQAVHLALAQSYFEQQELSTAARFADQVLESDPDHLEGIFLRGRIAAASGQWALAVSAFKALLAARPDLAEGYLHLAQVYAVQGETAAAAAVLGSGIGRFPDHRQMHLALARAHLVRGDYKAAEAQLLHWLKIAPADMQVQAELGDFYLSLKDVRQAEREYAEIVRKFPDQALGYLKLARLYAAREAFADAVSELARGYERNPRSTELLAELVRTHLAAGDDKAALALCQARLARNAEEAFAHQLLGQVHAHQGKKKEAALAFERAAALDPQWTEPVNHLAALLLTQNKQADAVRQLEAALDRNPRNPAAYLTLARIHEEARQYPAAIAHYERALEVMPAFSEAAARLALLLCERNAGPEDLDRALALVLDANRRHPGRADVLQAIAWVHYHRGAHDSALELLGPIAERAPDDPLVNYHLGMALLKSGQPEKARGKLELALQEKTPFVGRAEAEQALKTLKAASS